MWPVIGAIAGGALVSNFFDRKASKAGEMRLQDILDQYISPEISASRKKTSDIEKAFLGQVMDPRGYYESAERAAGGYARELFKPGGEISTLISKARGGTIGAGFAPEAAEGTNRAILRGGVEQISNRFAQEAAGLEQSRLGALAGAYGQRLGGYYNLLSSLFAALSPSTETWPVNRLESRL